MKQLALLISLCFTLSACTTVSDFIEMKPVDRGFKTCENAKPFKEGLKDIKALSKLINTAQGNIARGYALHKQCVDQEVPYTTTGDCYYDAWGHMQCNQYTSTRTVTSCHDVPVSIDVNAEQKKLDKYQKVYKEWSDTYSKALEVCVQKVSELSPEKAFELWENEELPELK